MPQDPRKTMNSTTIPFSSSPAHRIVRSAARIVLPALVAALAWAPQPAVASAAPQNRITHVANVVTSAPTLSAAQAPAVAITAVDALPQSSAPLATSIELRSNGRAAVSDERAAELSAGATQLHLAMLASLQTGTATRSALNRSDLPAVDLSGAAVSDSSPAAAGLKLGAAGAPVHVGYRTGLAGIVGGTVARATTSAGTLPKAASVHHGDRG